MGRKPHSKPGLEPRTGVDTNFTRDYMWLVRRFLPWLCPCLPWLPLIGTDFPIVEAFQLLQGSCDQKNPPGKICWLSSDQRTTSCTNVRLKMLTYGIASDKQLARQPISACSPSLQPRTGEIQAGERQLHIVIRKAEMGKLKYFAVLEKKLLSKPTWEVERERMLPSGQGAKRRLQERRQLTQEKQWQGTA